MGDVVDPPTDIPSVRPWWVRAAWELGVAGTAGGTVGLLLGVFSRLMMKLVAILAGPAHAGALTENGNVVGALTFEGTLELVVFAGIFPGLLAGAAYVILRPWLLPVGRWGRPILFALYLTLAFGRMVFTPGNLDFGRFGSAAVNVALFLALFAVAGVLVPPFAEALRRRTQRRPHTFAERAVLVIIALGAIPVTLLLLMGTGASIATILGFNRPPDPLAVVPLELALATFAIGTLARRWPVPTRASYAALALPVLAGAALTLNGVWALLTLLARDGHAGA